VVAMSTKDTEESTTSFKCQRKQSISTRYKSIAIYPVIYQALHLLILIPQPLSPSIKLYPTITRIPSTISTP
jgi:hypothetical protein